MPPLNPAIKAIPTVTSDQGNKSKLTAAPLLNNKPELDALETWVRSLRYMDNSAKSNFR